MVEETFEEEKVICKKFHILQKQAKDQKQKREKEIKALIHLTWAMWKQRNEEALIQTSLDYQGPLTILNFANIEEQKIYSSNNLS